MNVVAINELSAEKVEEIQKKQIMEEFKSVLNEEDVRLAMKNKAIEIINGLSNWDVQYHADFKSIASEFLGSNQEVKDAFGKMIVKSIQESEEGDLSYRIYQAIGEAVTNKLAIKVNSQ